MSRNFLLHFGDPNLGPGMSISALVPFADLMNHSVDPTVRWSWDSGSGQFVMNVIGNSEVAAGTELSIDYSPSHSGQDPRHQRPPYYFGVFYGFLERAAKDRRVFLAVEDGPFARRPLHNKAKL